MEDNEIAIRYVPQVPEYAPPFSRPRGTKSTHDSGAKARGAAGLDDEEMFVQVETFRMPFE